MADDIPWDELQAELDLKADLLLAHVLVHYLHQGHPYRLRTLNHNGIRWIEPGEFVLAVRVRDADAFWRLRDQLRPRFDAARERGIITDILRRQG